MLFHRPNPADSFENLRARISRFFAKPPISILSNNQLTLEFSVPRYFLEDIKVSNQSVTEFLDTISDSIPNGNLYLFGGIIRDIALFGKKGFNSDIDLVVEGDWCNCISYIKNLGAKVNKFGGYRLIVSGQLIDIWNIKETWAISEGLVNYKSVASLTETTVLNWDAILMNWRTKNFVCRDNYLEEIKIRALDIVLEDNPNPLGMAVRVFRHLCLKDAKKITPKAAEYLGKCANLYTFDKLTNSEFHSYGNSAINYITYKFFKVLNQDKGLFADEMIEATSALVKNEALTLPSIQMECDFGSPINEAVSHFA